MITKHFRIFFFLYIPFSCYNVWSSSEHNHWYDDIRSSCQWAIGLKFPSCSIFLMFLFSPFSFLMQMLSQLKLSGLLNCFLAIHMYALFFFYSLALSLALSFTYNTIYFIPNADGYVHLSGDKWGHDDENWYRTRRRRRKREQRKISS